MKLPVSKEKIDAFCLKWKVQELALFGSILREDFFSDSDVDVLVTFLPDADWSLYDWVDMIEDLEKIFDRKVDLVEKNSIRNPFRRNTILNTYEVVHAT